MYTVWRNTNIHFFFFFSNNLYRNQITYFFGLNFTLKIHCDVFK